MPHSPTRAAFSITRIRSAACSRVTMTVLAHAARHNMKRTHARTAQTPNASIMRAVCVLCDYY